MQMMRLPKAANTPGAVFAIETSRGYAYVQYVNPGVADAIRILPGIYVEEPNLNALVGGEDLGLQLFCVRALARDALDSLKYVDWFPLPRGLGDSPAIFVQQRLKDGSYHVTVGYENKIMPLGDSEAAVLPRFSIPGLPIFQRRLLEMNGLVPDPEPAERAVAAAVTHFLYFPSSALAKKAKHAVEEAVGGVSVVLEGDFGEDECEKYLVTVHDDHVSEPTRLIPILTRIAHAEGGEYDGLDAPF
jgi:hypothetical protein